MTTGFADRAWIGPRDHNPRTNGGSVVARRDARRAGCANEATGVAYAARNKRQMGPTANRVDARNILLSPAVSTVLAVRKHRNSPATG